MMCERCGRVCERVVAGFTAGGMAVVTYACPATKYPRTGLAGPLRAWLNRRHTIKVTMQRVG